MVVLQCKFRFLLVFLFIIPLVGYGQEIKQDSARYKNGLQKMYELDKSGTDEVLNNIKKISPEMADMIVEFAYGDVYTRKALSNRDRQLVTISALIALGNAKSQLKYHIKAGLNSNLTVDEIKEAMLQLAVYCGFPSAINGLMTLKEVLDETN